MQKGGKLDYVGLRAVPFAVFLGIRTRSALGHCDNRFKGNLSLPGGGDGFRVKQLLQSVLIRMRVPTEMRGYHSQIHVVAYLPDFAWNNGWISFDNHPGNCALVRMGAGLEQVSGVV